MTAGQVQAGSIVASRIQPMVSQMAIRPKAGTSNRRIRRRKNRREVPLT